MELRRPVIFFLLLLFYLPGITQENTAVRSVTFTGNQRISPSALKLQINTRPKTFLEKITFWRPGPALNSLILDDDINRVRNYYIRNGYPGANISHEVLLIRGGKKADIKIIVNEGKPVLVSDILWPELPGSEEQEILRKAISGSNLRPGQIFRDVDIFAAENSILKAFSERGYPLAQLDRNLFLGSDTGSVKISFVMDPGPLSLFGGVALNGDSLVPRKYILQQVTFKEGDLFSTRAMNITQQRLSSLDLFRFVTIRANTDSMADNRIPVSIRVSELQRLSVKAGAGYGVEDRLRLSVNLTRRKLFGGAQKLIFDAKHSHFDPIALDIKFIQPNFPLYRVDLAINPFFNIQRERSFEVQRAGGGITFQHTFAGRSSAWATWSIEQRRFKDLTRERSLIDEGMILRGSSKAGLTVGTSIDKGNDLFDPTKGWKFTGYFTVTGVGLKSDVNYYKVFADAARYLPIAPMTTLAARVRGGVMQPTGSSNITPIEDRFLAGGANSLRGWARNAISPVDEFGNQLGGNSLLESNIELRFPVYDIIGGALFFDCGNVWSRPYEFDLSGLHYDVGGGVRVKTPIGPGRIDVAFPLFTGKLSTLLFVTIGHAF